MSSDEEDPFSGDDDMDKSYIPSESSTLSRYWCDIYFWGYEFYWIHYFCSDGGEVDLKIIRHGMLDEEPLPTVYLSTTCIIKNTQKKPRSIKICNKHKQNETVENPICHHARKPFLRDMLKL